MISKAGKIWGATVLQPWIDLVDKYLVIVQFKKQFCCVFELPPISQPDYSRKTQLFCWDFRCINANSTSTMKASIIKIKRASVVQLDAQAAAQQANASKANTEQG